MTTAEDILEEAANHYTKVFEEIPMKKEFEDY